MGPESTAIFYQEIIKECQSQCGAQLDQDYPEIFIYNLPIPDIVNGLKEPEKVLPMLVEGAKKLEIIGVDFIVMPCNTATYFINEIRKELKIPFLSIVEETAKKINKDKIIKVGLLATKTTIEYKIYDKVLEKYKIEIIKPVEQKKVTEIIMNILSGKKLENDKQTLLKIVYDMKKLGAEAIVLGCTDLPVLFKKEETILKAFDTVEILAESTVREAYK